MCISNCSLFTVYRGVAFCPYWVLGVISLDYVLASIKCRENWMA